LDLGLVATDPLVRRNDLQLDPDVLPPQFFHLCLDLDDVVKDPGGKFDVLGIESRLQHPSGFDVPTRQLANATLCDRSKAASESHSLHDVGRMDLTVNDPHRVHRRVQQGLLCRLCSARPGRTARGIDCGKQFLNSVYQGFGRNSLSVYIKQLLLLGVSRPL
jgi:hypothetical protein